MPTTRAESPVAEPTSGLSHATCPPEPVLNLDEPGRVHTEAVADRTTHSHSDVGHVASESADDNADARVNETAAARTHTPHRTPAPIDIPPKPSSSTQTALDLKSVLTSPLSSSFAPFVQTPLPSDTKPSHTHVSSFLHAGATFKGTQRSDKQEYSVIVDVKAVDWNESFMCGYLRIEGLTANHPTLTTYFEGEMVGTKNTFITPHAEWGSNARIDMHHWQRFPAFRPLQQQARNGNFTMKNFYEKENIFMRWKEYFLVPDYRVRSISGASFEGFYFICFNQRSGTILGIYYHAKSEKYQQLEMHHVPNRGCVGAMEFR